MAQMKQLFYPKIIDTIRGYSREQFVKDLVAGIIVGIVALPLAIAFAIASGVSPEKGIITAVIAGFIISALGGSKVQIGGPTGAFIVIVYGIVQEFGINGLIIATFLAGIFLIVMGFAKLGNVIKFIPFPLIVGFTSGIAVIIFSSEVKDILGLPIEKVPADFIAKWELYARHIHATDFYALLTGVSAILIIMFWPRVTHKIPGSLIAILVTTAVVQFLHLPVETIGTRFGSIPSELPPPQVPHINLDTIKLLIKPAFTIALLGAIESLLSAVVADGMTGGNHRSNTELIAQGIANIFSPLFGGIPATGAIARTATNIKNGGRTPVAGIIHALTLLLIMLFVGKWAALIPMATLAGILIVVAYNMSEWENFVSVIKGSKSDAAVLLVTFLLTILIDLTVAIEIGMVLAVFLFMLRMTQISYVKQFSSDSETVRHDSAELKLPEGVEVFEVNGPLFFGAAYKFKDALRIIQKPVKVLIIRMEYVPVIDATGIRILKEIIKDIQHKGTKLVLSEVQSEQVMSELQKSRVVFMVGKANILDTFDEAIIRSRKILSE